MGLTGQFATPQGDKRFQDMFDFYTREILTIPILLFALSHPDDIPCAAGIADGGTADDGGVVELPARQRVARC